MNEEKVRKIRSFTDLDAWRESHQLVLRIYYCTKSFPEEERYGLTGQLRRAAVSITSNLAEGFSRESYKEKVLFYSMARGSMTELQNQLLIARDVGYMDRKTFDDLASRSVVAHKLVTGLIKSSRGRTRAP